MKLFFTFYVSFYYRYFVRNNKTKIEMCNVDGLCFDAIRKVWHLDYTEWSFEDYLPDGPARRIIYCVIDAASLYCFSHRFCARSVNFYCSNHGIEVNPQIIDKKLVHIIYFYNGAAGRFEIFRDTFQNMFLVYTLFSRIFSRHCYLHCAPITRCIFKYARPT